jgi:hypothetical protein
LSELVVSSCDAAKVLEATEAALDDISCLVCGRAEWVDNDTVGFVGDHRHCATIADVGAQGVAVIGFVGEEGGHERGKSQNIWRGGDVGGLAWGEVKDDRPAERIAQRMDFRRSTTARPADGLILFPPFPPEAQR